jgi:endoglucanase
MPFAFSRFTFSRLSGAFALAVLLCQTASSADSRETFAPSGRGGTLLPAGYLSTHGSQIVDDRGNPVRIASIGWYGTEGPAGYGMQGLWTVSYQSILDSIKADGFNTVRIPWSNVNLDVQPRNIPATGTIDFKSNSDLVGLTTVQIFQKVVAYAGQIGLKVVFDHHTDDGSGGQQPNGLWIDKGPGTDGTDGAGVRGTVDAARFRADWVRFAQIFAGNSTVIGFDLDNEPHGAAWGGGGQTDIHKMFEDVGNAIQAVSPGILIIGEPSQDYKGVTPEGNVTLAAITHIPVVLHIPNKMVYSVHEYPNEIGGETPVTPTEFVRRMNLAWGDVVSHNIAPVWIGEMGSNMTSADSKVWAKTLLDYMNGKDGPQGGPTFTHKQQPVSGSWWNIGSEGGQGNPDGIQTQWGAGHYKREQQAITDQMLFLVH